MGKGPGEEYLDCWRGGWNGSVPGRSRVGGWRPEAGKARRLARGPALAAAAMIRRVWGRRRTGERPRILIDCIEAFHFQHVVPLVKRLLAEDRVDLYVLENPGLAMEELLDRESGALRLLSPAGAKMLAFDVTISLDYGEMVTVPERGTWVFLPHGDGMKGGYTGSAALGKYDVVFALTRPQAELQRPHLRPGARLVEIGLMQGDLLAAAGRSERRRSEVVRSIGLKAGRPVVLYAPSWSARAERIVMSRGLLRLLAEQDAFNVIVKPHPNLLNPERCGGIDWVKVFHEIEGENVRVILDPSIPVYRFMPSADLLLSDISSVLYEFLFLDRPIVLHVREDVLEAIGGRRYLDQVLPAVSWFTAEEMVLERISEALRMGDTLSPARRRLLQERFFNIGCATERAVEWIHAETGIS